jgi:hypothetical protein
VDLVTQTHRDLLYGKAGAACCRGGHSQFIGGGVKTLLPLKAERPLQPGWSCSGRAVFVRLT